MWPHPPLVRILTKVQPSALPRYDRYTLLVRLPSPLAQVLYGCSLPYISTGVFPKLKQSKVFGDGYIPISSFYNLHFLFLSFLNVLSHLQSFLMQKSCNNISKLKGTRYLLKILFIYCSDIRQYTNYVKTAYWDNCLPLAEAEYKHSLQHPQNKSLYIQIYLSLSLYI